MVFRRRNAATIAVGAAAAQAEHAKGAAPAAGAVAGGWCSGGRRLESFRGGSVKASCKNGFCNTKPKGGRDTHAHTDTRTTIETQEEQRAGHEEHTHRHTHEHPHPTHRHLGKRKEEEDSWGKTKKRQAAFSRLEDAPCPPTASLPRRGWNRPRQAPCRVRNAERHITRARQRTLTRLYFVA